jgi:hypothetical protein
MQRYYFNVRRDETVFEDRAGVVLTDLSEAWRWALKDALKLVRGGYLDRTRYQYWIEVCDSRHSSVVTLPI